MTGSNSRIWAFFGVVKAMSHPALAIISSSYEVTMVTTGPLPGCKAELNLAERIWARNTQSIILL